MPVPVQPAPGACTEWIKTKYVDKNDNCVHLHTCRHMQVHAHTRKHALSSHDRTDVIGKEMIYIQITEISRHGNWEVAIYNQHRKAIMDSSNKTTLEACVGLGNCMKITTTAATTTRRILRIFVINVSLGWIWRMTVCELQKDFWREFSIVLGRRPRTQACRSCSVWCRKPQGTWHQQSGGT